MRRNKLKRDMEGGAEGQSVLRDSRKCKIQEKTNLLWPRTKSEQEAGALGMGQVAGACNYCSSTA